MAPPKTLSKTGNYMKLLNFFRSYIATIAYIATIVVANLLFSYLPMMRMFGEMVSPADALVGGVYIARDFAQREIGHRVVLAMVVGAALSYVFAAPAVATASVVAFVVGELIDWGIFTWTKRPLSDRLLLSSSISAPVDTLFFLGILHHLNLTEFVLMTLGKIVGVLMVWWWWRKRHLITKFNFGASQ